MARALADIERDIRALSPRERMLLLQSLIAELDGAAEPGVDRAWLEESERRIAEIEAGTAETIPGHKVMDEARSRIKK